jgi:putative FmdB family regulatory protein
MPFYEYECQNCKFYSELLQKISDPPLEKCPSCGKKTMKKLISAPVFRLKGAGWYETDFKSDNENKRNLAGADKEESKSEDSSVKTSDAKSSDAKPSDAKGDPKPAAAAETKTPAAPVEAKSSGSSGRSGRSSGSSAVAAKGGHKKAASKPVAKTPSRAPSKAKPKAKAKGKAGKGRR